MRSVVLWSSTGHCEFSWLVLIRRDITWKSGGGGFQSTYMGIRSAEGSKSSRDGSTGSSGDTHHETKWCRFLHHGPVVSTNRLAGWLAGWPVCRGEPENFRESRAKRVTELLIKPWTQARAPAFHFPPRFLLFFLTPAAVTPAAVPPL